MFMTHLGLEGRTPVRPRIVRAGFVRRRRNSALQKSKPFTAFLRFCTGMFPKNKCFQSLEKSCGFFPIIGNFLGRFSNHWKLVLRMNTPCKTCHFNSATSSDGSRLEYSLSRALQGLHFLLFYHMTATKLLVNGYEMFSDLFLFCVYSSMLDLAHIALEASFFVPHAF